MFKKKKMFKKKNSAKTLPSSKLGKEDSAENGSAMLSLPCSFWPELSKDPKKKNFTECKIHETRQNNYTNGTAETSSEECLYRVFKLSREERLYRVLNSANFFKIIDKKDAVGAPEAFAAAAHLARSLLLVWGGAGVGVSPPGDEEASQQWRLTPWARRTASQCPAAQAKQGGRKRGAGVRIPASSTEDGGWDVTCRLWVAAATAACCSFAPCCRRWLLPAGCLLLAVAANCCAACRWSVRWRRLCVWRLLFSPACVGVCDTVMGGMSEKREKIKVCGCRWSVMGWCDRVREWGDKVCGCDWERVGWSTTHNMPSHRSAAVPLNQSKRFRQCVHIMCFFA